MNNLCWTRRISYPTRKSMLLKERGKRENLKRGGWKPEELRKLSKVKFILKSRTPKMSKLKLLGTKIGSSCTNRSSA